MVLTLLGINSTLWLGSLIGLVSGCIVVMLPYVVKWLQAKLQERAESKNASVAGINKRVHDLEVWRAENEVLFKQVIQFIQGSEDPFTHEITGGLLKFMQRVEKILKIEKGEE